MGSIQWSFPLELWDLGLYGVTNNPSFQNYGINTVVEFRQSFLLELQNQHTFLSTEVTGSILNRGSRMIQSYYLLDDRSSPDLFWTKVQGWYNPITFSMIEFHRIRSEPKSKDDTILPPSQWPKFIGSVLNRSPRMIQSYHLLDDRSSPDPFWTDRKSVV